MDRLDQMGLYVLIIPTIVLLTALALRLAYFVHPAAFIAAIAVIAAHTYLHFRKDTNNDHTSQ